MRKEGIIIFVLLIIIALFLALIFIDFSPEPAVAPAQEPGELSSMNPVSEQTPEDNKTTEPVAPETQSVPAASSGGGGGAGGSGGGDVTEPATAPPPADLYIAPCGTYFTRYDVCAGSCPDGECVKEGRSCYCKIQ